MQENLENENVEKENVPGGAVTDAGVAGDDEYGAGNVGENHEENVDDNHGSGSEAGSAAVPGGNETDNNADEEGQEETGQDEAGGDTEEPGNPGEPGGGTSDETDGERGDEIGGEKGDTEVSASELPMIRNVMNLCVSMIDGRVKDEDLHRLLDAISARERIMELERFVAEERRMHAEELERRVAEAYAEGEIAGRNAQIEVSVVSSSGGGSVPSLGGSAGARPRRASSIFDLAASAR